MHFTCDYCLNCLFHLYLAERLAKPVTRRSKKSVCLSVVTITAERFVLQYCASARPLISSRERHLMILVKFGQFSGWCNGQKYTFWVFLFKIIQFLRFNSHANISFEFSTNFYASAFLLHH